MWKIEHSTEIWVRYFLLNQPESSKPNNEREVGNMKNISKIKHNIYTMWRGKRLFPGDKSCQIEVEYHEYNHQLKQQFLKITQ